MCTQRPSLQKDAVTGRQDMDVVRHAVDFYSREGRERCLWLYTWYTNPTSNSNFLIPGPSGPEKTQ